MKPQAPIIDDEKLAELNACILLRQALKYKNLARRFGVSQRSIEVRASRLLGGAKARRV